MTEENQMVKEAEQIMPYVESTLKELGLSYEVRPSGLYLPEGQDRGIYVGEHLMRILPEDQLEQEFREYSSEKPPINLGGFADRAMDVVYLKEGPFCNVFIEAGHELGHILSENIEDPVNEEAKAFAFQLAWQEAAHKTLGYTRGLVMDSISSRLNDLPNNGSYQNHRQAYEIVRSLQKEGFPLMDLYQLFAEKEEVA